MTEALANYCAYSGLGHPGSRNSFENIKMEPGCPHSGVFCKSLDRVIFFVYSNCVNPAGIYFLCILDKWIMFEYVPMTFCGPLAQLARAFDF